MSEERRLLPEHRALLDASAISPEVAAARGYWSIQTRGTFKNLGFGEHQGRVPALAIPIHNVCGDPPTLYQIRPDTPRVRDGKPLKYELPRGATMLLDVHPFMREKLGDPGIPLFVTEGIRKADSAISRGLCCIALLGVWNWRGTNERGGTLALPDWDSIALNGRLVYICFDSDVMTKREVHSALARLAAFLKSRAAAVRFIYLPHGPDGSKWGMDDFFAAGHSVDDLMSLATDELRPIEGGDGDCSPYYEHEGGMWWRKSTPSGEQTHRLTNFVARIVGDVTRDDGAETQRSFEIEARLNCRTSRFALPASVCRRLEWPDERLGAAALVEPGLGIQGRAWAAIKTLSGAEIPERTVFLHTGWRHAKDVWAYLHGGGAIGPDGPIAGVEVALPDRLSRYVLPEPPAGSALREAIRASLAFLEVAPPLVTFPILGGVYRAVLRSSNLSLHVAGATGRRKTALALLALQHYGPEMSDSEHIPGNWDSTANSLALLAFSAKDSLVVIDDFRPDVGGRDIAHLTQEADRLFRGQGNQSGRGRLRRDASELPSKAPRGLLLSTGEDTPRGESLRARLVIVEVGPDAVDLPHLTACQSDAASGLYAAAMAGFVQWLAPRYESLLSRLPQEVRELRAKALTPGMHGRTAENAANLAVGWRHWLAFAVDVGAITEAERDDLWRRAWAALTALARAQAPYLATSEPAGLFIRLLGAAIASGQAHLVSKDGDEPPDQYACGWRLIAGAWRPQGACVGWIVEADLYAQPTAAYATADRLGQASGHGIGVGEDTLRRRLRDRGFLVSWEAGREKLTKRKTLGGRYQAVLHLRAADVIGQPDSDENADLIPEDAGPGAKAPASWAGFDEELGRLDTEAAHTEAAPTGIPDAPSPVGPVGPAPATQEAPGVAPALPPAPTRPCFSCGRTVFWLHQTPGSLWRCESCYRPPFPEVVAQRVDIGDRSQEAKEAEA